jgi:hypothetical protein
MQRLWKTTLLEMTLLRPAPPGSRLNGFATGRCMARRWRRIDAVVDLGLPRLDGLSLLRMVRERNAVPVLVPRRDTTWEKSTAWMPAPRLSGQARRADEPGPAARAHPALPGQKELPAWAR